jgi:hypothetical protein
MHKPKQAVIDLPEDQSPGGRIELTFRNFFQVYRLIIIDQTGKPAIIVSAEQLGDAIPGQVINFFCLYLLVPRRVVSLHSNIAGSHPVT